MKTKTFKWFPNELDFKKSLIEEGKIKILHLGIFYTRKVLGRALKHPRTGELTAVKPHTRIGFRATASLKRFLN